MVKVIEALDIDLEELNESALSMEQFFRDNPGAPLVKIFAFVGNTDPREWRALHDRFGRVLLGCHSRMEVGKVYAVNEIICAWNGGKSMPFLGTVTRRASMAEVVALAGTNLQHKPFVYELMCD